MAANTIPIFPITPNVSWTSSIATANTAKDGTGTAAVAFTAGTEGSKIDQIKVRALGTNIATVLRLFINNGASAETATNNTLIHEVTIAATTLAEDSALADNDILIVKDTGVNVSPIPYLPGGYKILATVGTTIAAGLQVTVHGGDY